MVKKTHIQLKSGIKRSIAFLFIFIMIFLHSSCKSEESIEGAIRNLIEGPDTQTAPSGTLTVTSITRGDMSLTVTWTAVDEANSYDVRYRETGSSGSFMEQNNITGLSATIIDLVNGVEYDVQIRAVNTAGTGEWSEIISGTPLEALLGTLTVISVTRGDMSLTVTWTAVDEANSYDVRYRETGSSGSFMEQNNITGLSATIIDLVNGVEYDVQIRAVNTAGTGEWSEIMSGTPLEAPPDTPTVISVTRGDMSLTATWAAVDGANSYDVRYRETGSSGSFMEQSNITVLSAIITGLVNGTEYDVQVRVVNTSGVSGWSEVMSGTPLGTTPDTPTMVSVTSGDMSLTVTWTAVNGADSYDIRYKETAGSGSFIEQSNVISPYEITSLMNDTSYDVQVRSANTAGTSGWSEVMSKTTLSPAYTTITLPYSASIESGKKQYDYTLLSDDLTGGNFVFGLNGLDSGGSLKVFSDPSGSAIDRLCESEVQQNFQASCTIASASLSANMKIYIHVTKSMTPESEHFTLNYGKGEVNSPYILPLNHDLNNQRLPLKANLYFHINGLDSTKGYKIKNTRVGRASTSLEAFHQRDGNEYRLLACKTNLAHKEASCKLTGISKLFLKLVTNKFYWESFQSSIKIEEFEVVEDTILPQGTPDNPFIVDLEGRVNHTISNLKAVHNSRSYYKLINLPNRNYTLNTNLLDGGGSATRFNAVLHTDPEFRTFATSDFWDDRLLPRITGAPTYEFALENIYWTNHGWLQSARMSTGSALYLRMRPTAGGEGIKFTLRVVGR